MSNILISIEVIAVIGEISQNLVHYNKNLMISETSLNSFEPVCGQTLELTDTCDIFPVTKLTWPRKIGFFPFFPNFKKKFKKRLNMP